MDERAPESESSDEILNRDCFCITLDRGRLREAINAEVADAALASRLLEARPHLFAGMPVFLSRRDLAAMKDVIDAIEAVAAAPAYQATVLAWAPAVAQHDFGPRGAMTGYDFHLGEGGPKLIEVNTNAGGAFLNAVLARAQTACCREAEDAMGASQHIEFEPAVWRMFVKEWQAQGRRMNLRPSPSSTTVLRHNISFQSSCWPRLCWSDGGSEPRLSIRPSLLFRVGAFRSMVQRST